MKKILMGLILLLMGLFQNKKLMAVSLASSELGSIVAVSTVVIPSIVILDTLQTGSQIAGAVAVSTGVVSVAASQVAGEVLVVGSMAAESILEASAISAVVASGTASQIVVNGIKLGEQVLESSGNSQTLLSKDGIVIVVNFSTPTPNLVITDFLTKQELKKLGIDTGAINAYAGDLGVLLYTRDKVVVFYPKENNSKVFNEIKI